MGVGGGGDGGYLGDFRGGQWSIDSFPGSRSPLIKTSPTAAASSASSSLSFSSSLWFSSALHIISNPPSHHRRGYHRHIYPSSECRRGHSIKSLLCVSCPLGFFFFFYRDLVLNHISLYISNNPFVSFLTLLGRRTLNTYLKSIAIPLPSIYFPDMGRRRGQFQLAKQLSAQLSLVKVHC